MTLNQANPSHSIDPTEPNTNVIDHMARLDFDIKPEGGTLVSFHYEYNDYLDEIGCVDPQTAKEIQARTRISKA